MTAQRIWLAGLAVLLVGALSLLGSAFMRGRFAEATPNPWEVAIDCAPGGAVDSACTPAPGPVTVDIILRNTSGSPDIVSGVSFTVRADQSVAVPVVPGSCTAPKFNCNPDFNESMGGGDWSCSPVLADQNATAEVADSLISCINAEGPDAVAPVVTDGSSLLLASVTYNYSGGSTALTLRDVNVYNKNVTELISCHPVLTNVGDCFEATLDPAPATNTPLPTSTNTPLPTAATSYPTEATSRWGA